MNEIDLRRFDLNLLVVFEVLMTERSVNRAAERLDAPNRRSATRCRGCAASSGDPLLIKGRRADAADRLRA